MDYAGFWRRALAATLDNLTWLVAGSVVLSLFPESAWDDDRELIGVVLLILFSAWFNYFALTEWRWGQTIGKNATGIEVRSVDGAERLTFGQASVRNLLRIVDFFVIGEVMIATTERKQRLGDKAANTVVVRRQPAPARTTPVAATAAGTAPPAAGPPPVRGGADADAGQAAPPPPAAAPAAPRPSMPDRRLPLVPWTPKETAWGLIGGLLLAVIVPPILVLPFDPDLESPGALLVAQGIFDGLLVMVALGMASRWKFRPLRRTLALLGIRPFRLSALGIMVATLVVYYIAAALFATLVLEPEQEDIGGDLGIDNPNPLVVIAAVVMIAGVAPITEELFFRGFVFAGLRSRWSLWPAAIVSGLVFGLVHAPTGITAVIPLAVLGIALCWLYDRTGSLWPPVIAHVINNSLALIVISADSGVIPLPWT